MTSGPLAERRCRTFARPVPAALHRRRQRLAFAVAHLGVEVLEIVEVHLEGLALAHTLRYLLQYVPVLTAALRPHWYGPAQ